MIFRKFFVGTFFFAVKRRFVLNCEQKSRCKFVCYNFSCCFNCSFNFFLVIEVVGQIMYVIDLNPPVGSKI